MWRKNDQAPELFIDLRSGMSLTIPVGTSFQFRNLGGQPLTAIGVTMPPWPGSGEAMEVEGAWEPRVSTSA
jgi:mannose-6-phosphate isomerase-like protein (cupin superfamily)